MYVNPPLSSSHHVRLLNLILYFAMQLLSLANPSTTKSMEPDNGLDPATVRGIPVEGESSSSHQKVKKFFVAPPNKRST
jgi:hypothetical protein